MLATVAGRVYVYGLNPRKNCLRSERDMLCAQMGQMGHASVLTVNFCGRLYTGPKIRVQCLQKRDFAVSRYDQGLFQF